MRGRGDLLLPLLTIFRVFNCAMDVPDLDEYTRSSSAGVFRESQDWLKLHLSSQHQSYFGLALAFIQIWIHIQIQIQIQIGFSLAGLLQNYERAEEHQWFQFRLLGFDRFLLNSNLVDF